MATVTSTKSGDWSDATVWTGGTGVPADNDSVVIASGHIVTYNVDNSAFSNGIAGITVTGTLTFTTTTGTYALKIKAATSITGAGTVNIGTAGSPIPFAAKHSITGGAGWFITGTSGLTLNVYGTEPTVATARMTVAKSSGATALDIDTNLTADIWSVANVVRIDNVNKGKDSETKNISSITSSVINLTAGLTTSKIAGALIHLVSRNVTITANGDQCLRLFASGKLNIGSVSFIGSANAAINTCTNPTISGGVFTGNGYVLQGCTGGFITGGVFTFNTQNVNTSNGVAMSGGIITGGTYAVYSSSGFSMTGGFICGNTNGIINCPSTVIAGGLIYGNGTGVNSCSGKISNAQFYGTAVNAIGNTTDINMSMLNMINVSFASSGSTDVANYQSLSKLNYTDSVNHNKSAGSFKSWTGGGITTTVTTPVPTGFTRSYQLALENASEEGFCNRHVNVPAGKTISINLYLRKSASMTYAPVMWVYPMGVDPFSQPGSILKTFTSTQINVWETDTYSYTNSENYDVELEIRTVGMASTDYVYSQISDSFAASGGSGISRTRVLGGAG